MKKPKYIMLFIDSLTEINMLSDAQTGRLIKAAMTYAGTGETPDFSDDAVLSVMFSQLRRQIDREFESYEKMCEKHREAGRKGGAPKGNSNARKTTKTTKTSEQEEEEKQEEKEEDKKEEEYEYNEEQEEEQNAQTARLSRAGSAVFTPEIPQIIDYLNERAGTHYRPSSKRTAQQIRALLNEGYTIEDMKSVVDKQCAEWLHNEYARFLRPETLFGEKFESYLNAPKKRTPIKKPHREGWYEDSYLSAARKWADDDWIDHRSFGSDVCQ